MLRDVHSGRLKLNGEEYSRTLTAANSYALCLMELKRSQEAKKLLRKTVPVARRVLGEGHEITLKMRWSYAAVLIIDSGGATLDALREVVMTLEDTEQTARRVLGGAHPLTGDIKLMLQQSREVLRLSELASVDSVHAAPRRDESDVGNKAGPDDARRRGPHVRKK